jgi:glutamate formiminotransferase
MVSFSPLSEARASAIPDQMHECDELAWQLGQQLGERGCPVLMYGGLAGRTLLETRRGTSFFRSTKAGSPREATCVLPLDFGQKQAAPPSAQLVLPQRSGVAIVGVQPYVTNFNVCVANASLEACRAAATVLRNSMGVQVMALPHAEGTVEIGCNLQARDDADSPDREGILNCIVGALPAESSIVRSYVIGLTPGEANEKAERILLRAVGGATRGERYTGRTKSL